MRKTILASAAALALSAATPALAGGGPDLEINASTAGKAAISGKTTGGSYAFGKNGSDAFALSSNVVRTFGTSNVDLGQSENFGVSSSYGKSLARTNGAGSVAEAFETRNLRFSNFTRFNVNAEIEFGGFQPFD